MAAVSGNGEYRSERFIARDAGTYRWVVSYSGDLDNRPTGPTACLDADERVEVDRRRPRLSSTASGVATRLPSGQVRITRTLGVRLHDTAHLTGGVAPRGSITFRLYGPGDSDCSGVPRLTSVVGVYGNGNYHSATFLPVGAGTYRWVVEYSGDSDNEPAGPTACGEPAETVVVGRDRPDLRSAASGSVEVGGTVRDVAFLLNGTAPSGKITFQLFGPDDGTCSGSPAFASSADVVGDGAYSSGPFTPSQPGVYRWVVSYSGDSNNAPAGPTPCSDLAETVVVRSPPFVPAQPALSSTASAPAVAGSAMRDTAHLSGGDAPTGAVTFELYGPGDATCTGVPVFASSAAVSGNGDYTSEAFTPEAPGTYRWRVSYAGDAGNAPAGPTACGDPDETVAAGKASPRIGSTAEASAAFGEPLSDTVHLTGGASPTGTVTFRLYGPDDDGCSGTPAFSAQLQVNGNRDYTSPSFESTQAGTYRWVTSYSGDAANDAAGPTACGETGENTSVARARPGMFSLASGALVRRLAARRRAGETGGSIGLRPRPAGFRYRATGLPIHDTVHLYGGADPRGFITYSLYGPGDSACAGPPVFVTETTVTGNGDYLSEDFVPSYPGTYRWVASYSGDFDNAPAGPTDCGAPAETVVVPGPSSPSLSSAASRDVTLGGSVSDTATLSGGQSPTGLLTFKVFGPDDDDCSSAPVLTTTAAVSGDGAYPTEPFTPVAVGTYRWVVSYSGDSFNTPAGPTACSDSAETVVVRRRRPTLATTASAPGEPLRDTAHLNRGVAPTGSITFRLFGPDDSDCSGSPVFTSTVPVAGNGDYNSETFSPVAAGTYRWVARYAGDSGNEPAGPTACDDAAETVVVARYQPRLSSVASGSVEVGGTVSDVAFLIDGTAPTGTITFRLFGPDDSSCAAAPAFTSSAAVAGNGVYTSGPFTPTQPGVYRWVASYSGDPNNAPAGPSACSEPGEAVVVRAPFVPAQPALSSTASAPAVVGAAMRDTAHLSVGDAPTGAVTFVLYGPDDATCSGVPAFTSSAVVSGNGDYTSAAFTPTDPGTYRWRVSYGGDAGNAPAGPTQCGDPDETVAAGKTQPAITSTATPRAAFARSISDTVHLTGGVSPRGTIRFRLYGPDDDDCSGTPAFSALLQVGGNGDYTSPSFEPTRTGTYRWVTSYSGDAANGAAGPSACGESGENTSVARKRPGMFSLASGATARRLADNQRAGATGGRIGLRPRQVGFRYRAAGLPIHDTVHLYRGADPGGFITYSLYGPGDESCSGPPVFVTQTVVSGNGDYLSRPFIPTRPGTYRWVARYSGDPDNRPAGPTACGERAETVVVLEPAQPTLSSTASGAVTLGGAIHDTAHLSGGSSPTGRIGFRLYGPDDSDCSGEPAFTSSVGVAGNGDYDSAEFTPQEPGTYRWVVRYSGDSGNRRAGPTACGDAAAAVEVRPPGSNPAETGFSTVALAGPAAIGTPIYDVATLIGGSSPTGAISFALYGPDDATCTKPPVFTSRTAVAGTGDHRSDPYVVVEPGVYRWVAQYSGDAANASAGPSACGEAAETVTVAASPAPNPNEPFEPTPGPSPGPVPAPTPPSPTPEPVPPHPSPSPPAFTGRDLGMRVLLGNTRLSDERTLSRWAYPARLSAIRRVPAIGSRRVGRLRWLTEDGAPEVYLALRSRRTADGRLWIEIPILGRPNGRTGWVERKSLGLFGTVATALLIDRPRSRATLYRSGREVWQTPIGHGAPETPTPAGRFYIREKLSNAGGSPVYGPLAFGTSAYSSLSDWPRGGVIGIHGTNEPWLIPGRPSHGCIRVRNPQILQLARLMPIGTPVRIR
jgi:hypothetical protein